MVSSNFIAYLSYVLDRLFKFNFKAISVMVCDNSWLE
nr:MAG TPA: Mannitol dehydrogenase Rossmann domain [Siphoviridae sp. ctHmS4]